jgi:hypothetical protein
MKQIFIEYKILMAFLFGLCVSFYGHSQATMQKKPADTTIKFKKFAYTDTQGTGLEAFSFLMPADWQFEGGIFWLPDKPSMPANSAFRVFNPSGNEEFEILPGECFFWTTNLQLLGLFPPGTRYFGNTVKKPVNALNALNNIVLKNTRGSFPGLTVISKAELPELVEAIGIGKQNTGPVRDEGTGAKIRISYLKNGVPMEEEIWGVSEIVTFPLQSMMGTTFNSLWYLHYLISFKAKKGELDNYTGIFQTITSSFRINQAWQAKYNNVVEYMAQQQIQKIRSVGEFSRMLSNMSDQMREDQLRQFEQRSSVYDRVAEKFSDNILGIDRYFDPFEGRHVELPSGYNHVWCNNNGEYILTDNPNFNPNENSNLNWQPLQKK